MLYGRGSNSQLRSYCRDPLGNHKLSFPEPPPFTLWLKPVLTERPAVALITPVPEAAKDRVLAYVPIIKQSH